MQSPEMLLSQALKMTPPFILPSASESIPPGPVGPGQQPSQKCGIPGRVTWRTYLPLTGGVLRTPQPGDSSWVPAPKTPPQVGKLLNGPPGQDTKDSGASLQASNVSAHGDAASSATFAAFVQYCAKGGSCGLVSAWAHRVARLHTSKARVQA